MSETQSLLLLLDEAARLLSLSRAQLYNLTRPRSGVDIPVVKLGKKLMVPRAALEQWVQQLQSQ